MNRDNFSQHKLFKLFLIIGNSFPSSTINHFINIAIIHIIFKNRFIINIYIFSKILILLAKSKKNDAKFYVGYISNDINNYLNIDYDFTKLDKTKLYFITCNRDLYYFGRSILDQVTSIRQIMTISS